MKLTPCLTALALTLLTAPAAETRKPLPDRVKEFSARYGTEGKITKRLTEWTKEEPHNPEPYILAANAYLKCADQVTINAGARRPGFASIVDPKTGKEVGSIGEAPDPRLVRLALATLAIAAEKFPHRLDIHVGRMSIAERAGDVGAMLAAGEDMIAATLAQGGRMRWIDDAPLPAPVEEKVPDELQGRIAWLFAKSQDAADEAAFKLASEALKIAPANVRLLNDAAVFHLYKKQWLEAMPYLDRAEKADPQDLFIKHNLARAAAALGQNQLACAKWQEIIKLSPGSEDA